MVITAKNSDVIITEDNTKLVLSALKKAKQNGLKAIGMSAESHAKDVLTKVVYTRNQPTQGYILTGRLRNSITWALSGKKANISSYEADVQGEAGGSYNGTAPNEGDAVFVGTNVIYAPGIELGTRRKAGAVHFLRRAATEHTEEYKRLMEDALRNA